MSFFVRLFIAWLIAAALPLQGFAAASMVLCGQGAMPAVAVQEDAAPHRHPHADGHTHHAVDDASPAAGPDEAHATAPDPSDHHGHSCIICASCCHVMALAETVAPLLASESPSAALPQPSAPVTTRASPVPDKPPRA